MRNAGLIEYLLVFGAVLGLAVFELVSVIRSQRRDQQMLDCNGTRSQAEGSGVRDRPWVITALTPKPKAADEVE